jgi:hypothetical protein
MLVAQFSLSRACFLLTYPLAGFLGVVFSLVPTAVVVAVLGVVGVARAWWACR